jgi:hypothetical protein
MKWENSNDNSFLHFGVLLPWMWSCMQNKTFSSLDARARPDQQDQDMDPLVDIIFAVVNDGALQLQTTTNI